MTDSLDTKSERLISRTTGKLIGLLRRPEAHPDLRGSVRETYRASWFPEVPPIKQLTQSNSKPNTLRGMHLHRKQWDIWRFTSDGALVRLIDHTDQVETYVEMGKGEVLAIPPGISHGFWTASGCTLLYGLTEEYDGTDEFGWYPFDGLCADPCGTLAHEWPRDHAGLNVSERDLRAPRLADFKG